jgi:hypothetical protein
VIVRIIRVDAPTTHKRWVSRRINDTLRSILFSVAVVPITSGKNACQSGVGVSVHPTPQTGMTVFDCEFDADWTLAGIYEFIRYMENSKNVVTAFLTAQPNHGTIPPCNTAPQLATSAT